MSEQYVTLAEVRDLLDEEHAKRELQTSQKAAMEHARAVCQLSIDDTKSIVEEIGAIGGIPDYAAAKIADLLPVCAEDVRAIFSKERITLEPKTIDQIIEVVGKYL